MADVLFLTDLAFINPKRIHLELLFKSTSWSWRRLCKHLERVSCFLFIRLLTPALVPLCVRFLEFIPNEQILDHTFWEMRLFSLWSMFVLRLRVKSVSTSYLNGVEDDHCCLWGRDEINNCGSVVLTICTGPGFGSISPDSNSRERKDAEELA